MDSIHVSIRELKSRLSSYLRLTKAGQSVVITERGKPIGRIVPIERSLDERLGALVDAGVVEWNGSKPGRLKPKARAKGNRTVAELLVEDRE